MMRILSAVALGACLIGLVVPSVQAASGSASEAPEEITVTGSYIKRDNFDLSSPTAAITSVDIELSATTNMGDIVFDMPQNLGTEVIANPGASGAIGAAQGVIATPNLRGLGARSTMTMMDGHRLLFGDANFNYPQIAIERVEVLLDGASALYGSEAIAGVVNYIPKKNFDGMQFQIERRDYGNGDYTAPDDKFAILAGSEGERSNVLFALEFRERERLEQFNEPDYLRKSAEQGRTYIFPGAFFVQNRRTSGAQVGQPFTTLPNPELASGASASVLSRWDPGCGHTFMSPGTDLAVQGNNRWGIRRATGVAAATPSIPYHNTTNQNCTASFSDLLDYNAELRHLHAYTRFEYRLTDFLTFNADVMFGRRKFDTRSTPTPGTVADPIVVPGELPGNPFVAFVDGDPDGAGPLTGTANGFPNGTEFIRAVDQCNYLNCTGGDGIPDRTIDGINPAPAVQSDVAFPVLLPAVAQRFYDGVTPGAGFAALNNDVIYRLGGTFFKNLQGLPSGVEEDGSMFRTREDRIVRYSAGFQFEVPDTSWTGSLDFIYGDNESKRRAPAQGNFTASGLTSAVTCIDPVRQPGRQGCFQFNPFHTSQFRVMRPDLSGIHYAALFQGPDALFTGATPLVEGTDFVYVQTPADDPAANTTAEIDRFFVYAPDLYLSEIRIVDAVASGELFELPWGGTVSAALGGHYRFETEDTTPDPVDAVDDLYNGLPVRPRKSEQKSTDWFGELSVPLLLPEQPWSLGGYMELQVAARTTDIRSRGIVGTQGENEFDDLVHKIGLLYQPTDWLSLRASLGEGFIAPTLTQLFQDPSTTQRVRVDSTCQGLELGTAASARLQVPQCFYSTTGAAQTSILTETVRPNTRLVPENSDAMNFGVTMKFLDGDLTLQADWLHIEFRDVIVALTATSLLQSQTALLAGYYRDRCGPLPASNTAATAADRACAARARVNWILGMETDTADPRAIPVPGGGEDRDRITRLLADIDINLDGTPEFVNQPLGLIDTVALSSVNTETRKVTTQDFTVDYRFDATQLPLVGGDYGEFRLRLVGTYMSEFDYFTSAGLAVSGAGQRNDTGGDTPAPRWRGQGSLTWLYQDHTTRLTARYHHHVSDLSLTGGVQPLLNSRGKIPSALYVDLSYQYVWNEPFGIDGRTTLTAGISNVFSYRPPPIEDSGGFDGFLSGQGHLGRIWNLRIAHQM